MTQKQNAKPIKKGKRYKNTSHRTAIVFWICLVLIAIPFVALGVNLYASSQSQHTPVIGNRYKGDLDPAITKAQEDQIQTKAAAVEGVQKADVQLVTGTLRIYADINDDATADTATAAANSIYQGLSEVLDPTVYFTKTDSKKMYDLEIHVYNKAERQNTEGENFVYVIETKTSSMDAPAAQVVSDAKDAALAQQLRDDVAARAAAAAADQNTTTGGAGENPDQAAGDTTTTQQ